MADINWGNGPWKLFFTINKKGDSEISFYNLEGIQKLVSIFNRADESYTITAKQDVILLEKTK